MNRNKTPRRGHATGLADKVAQDIVGMTLAQAFVHTRAAGHRIVVNRLDGVSHRPAWSGRGTLPVYVDVKLGIVQQARSTSWPAG